VKIWCPGCEWKPMPKSRWSCAPNGCRHTWNTFDTGGVCPGCSKIWHRTQCLRCFDHYPHYDWYHDDIETDAIVDIDEALEQILTKPGVA